MTARHHPATETFEGAFQHPIYSPKGGIEGALLHVADGPLQLVFDPHGEPGATAFARLKKGAIVGVEALAEGPSDKGGAAHAVYRFERLVSIDGKQPAASTDGRGAAFSGTVVRLNFARHGEANGVVLDSGDFIHTKPDGMAKLKLRVGDRVEADGQARLLADGAGHAVDATRVNGKAIGKPKLRA